MGAVGPEEGSVDGGGGGEGVEQLIVGVLLLGWKTPEVKASGAF